jgi:hypothetical protein
LKVVCSVCPFERGNRPLFISQPDIKRCQFCGRDVLFGRPQLVENGLRFEGCTTKPGFVKGTGDFDLEEKDGATLIKYAGEMQVGGTIAGIGQRMIQGAAKMMAARFFTALEAETTTAES